MSPIFQRILSYLCLAAVLGLVYGLTIAPGLTWANSGADGGDFISAAYTGGVPHPSGYPLYLLLVRAAQLLPLGKMAFRSNLLSAGLAILAALAAYGFMRRVDGQKLWGLPAWLAALALGLAPAVWGQAVITEVYTLHLLFAVLITSQALAGWRGLPAGRADLLRGITFGLGLSNHVTTVFLLPALCLEPSGKPDFGRILRRGAGAVLVAVLLYSTLMLRASQHAPVNWGNPSTPARLAALVSGQIYQEYVGQAGLDISERAALLLGDISIQFGIVGLVLALLGLFFVPVPRNFYLLSGSLAVASIGFVLFYNTADSFVYLLPLYFLLAVYLERGIGYCASFLQEKRGPGLAVLSLVVIALSLGWNVAQNWSRVDASRDQRAEEFAREIWQKAPQDAILVVRDDQASLSLWYYQFVEGQRPDTAIVVLGLLDYDWYRQMLRDTYPSLKVPEGAADVRKAIEQANPARAACVVLADPIVALSCNLRK